ncbi:MoxR-like ATPase [Tahibacter aquaticus]|uniref:MoxR-like ATPase n=1 Tax=Tahibacter aquaticus TaxID=520092 RepID=A0A4R6Z0C1_9GAMM|nr:MoxR family ATPase [Tahibacter aquaticus]TDR44942.1 MoxR-like ATPase [Tahibacter aquaticus]
MSTHYHKLFDPDLLARTPPAPTANQQPNTAGYEYDEAIVLAVNVALATGRPLLLRGEPGSGKSTLAADVARLKRWRYFEVVISSKTEASELLWRVDQVGRIADAQAGRLHENPANYIDPGVLWWALNPAQALRRGMASQPAAQPLRNEQTGWVVDDPDNTPAVILIDEIDKAEPDFPNDLLVPLGVLWFSVRAMGVDVRVDAATHMRPLLMITTNDERDLPPAFMRRCIVLDLLLPDRERLRKIVRRHLSEEQLDDTVLQRLLQRFGELREVANEQRLRPPSAAELLDAARALVGLGTDNRTTPLEHLEEISKLALWKHGRLAGAEEVAA